MKILFVDVETTGVSVVRDSIIQISSIFTEDGIEKERFDFRIKPYKEGRLTPFLEGLLGVTNSEIEKNMEHTEVYKKVKALIDKYTNNGKEKIFICAYNGQFDVNFISDWFQLNGEKFFFKYFYSPVIDVMYVAGFALSRIRPMMPNFKLGTVYKTLFNEDLDEAHNSMADIEGTMRIYEYLCKNLLPTD